MSQATALADVDLDPRLVFCACGCGTPVNGKMLAILDLSNRGMSLPEIGERVDLTPASVKTYRTRARAGRWPTLAQGHRVGSTPTVKLPCPWPGCDGLRIASQAHCQRQPCALPRFAWNRARHAFRREYFGQHHEWPSDDIGPQPSEFPAEPSTARIIRMTELRQVRVSRFAREARMDRRANAHRAALKMREALALLPLDGELRDLCVESLAEAKRTSEGHRWLLSLDSQNPFTDRSLLDIVAQRPSVDDAPAAIGPVVGSTEWWALVKACPIIPTNPVQAMADDPHLRLVVVNGEPRFMTVRLSYGDAVPWRDVVDPLPFAGSMSADGKMRSKGKVKAHIRRKSTKKVGGRRPKQKSKVTK